MIPSPRILYNSNSIRIVSKTSENPTIEPAKKYFAFVSYNSADRQEAEKLQRQIERYRLPAIIREEVTKKTATLCPPKLSPIFRDITDLPVGPLSELLRKELEQSRYLIVVCSPNAAKSNWVNREAEHFTRLGLYDRIIPYIIADDKTIGFNTCVPPVLRDPPEFQDDAIQPYPFRPLPLPTHRR